MYLYKSTLNGKYIIDFTSDKTFVKLPSKYSKLTSSHYLNKDTKFEVLREVPDDLDKDEYKMIKYDAYVDLINTEGTYNAATGRYRYDVQLKSSNRYYAYFLFNKVTRKYYIGHCLNILDRLYRVYSGVIRKELRDEFEKYGSSSFSVKIFRCDDEPQALELLGKVVKGIPESDLYENQAIINKLQSENYI